MGGRDAVVPSQRDEEVGDDGGDGYGGGRAAEPGHDGTRPGLGDARARGRTRRPGARGRITHGGLVFALADTAFAIACNEDDRVTVAAGADISFLKPTVAGQTLTATAIRRTRTGRSGLYDVTVVDEQGDAVAEFRGRSRTTSQTF
ncbi:unnamed protein product [Penicillium discolor]